jgi:hypothetical protein
MGHRNTVSGHIQESWYVAGTSGTDDSIRRLWASNRTVIESLPVTDVWPPLCREMFAFSSDDGGTRDRPTNTYRGRVIYFGGSFSSIYLKWTEWLEKFESLLRQLYWEQAAVVLTTEWMGEFVYHWRAAPDHSDASVIQPVQSWEFTGEPRSFGNW